MESKKALRLAGDRLAWWGSRVLWVTVALAILGGIAYAIIWMPFPPTVEPEVETCPNPPCFGDGTLPRASDLPVILPFFGYILAIVLGSLSGLVGIWDLFRGRWKAGLWRLLPFFGPILVLAGMEIIPHLLNPCLLLFLLGAELKGMCAGWDVADRWHALHHALIGALPLVFLYTRLLSRQEMTADQLRTSSAA